MKIFFISRYQRKVQRGVENYVTELSAGLSKRYQVEVLTSIKELVGKKPDIIYPLNGGFQACFCRIYSWLVGAKLVLGGHAGIGRDDRWNLYMFPDLFIAFSQKGYEWAKKINPFIKIIKIPHGVDLQKFNPHVEPAKVYLENPVFVTVSHLEPYKRVDLTVKAVAKLKKGSLLVLGEGPEAEKIDRLGNRLLNKIATGHTGRYVPRNDNLRQRYLRLQVSHNQVASYLRAADVFTLVSESSEAFGMVYLEAMACGLPVAATDDSLRRELIGKAGLLVKDPQNIGEYARVLEQAADFDWEKKTAEQVREYDWKKIAARYLKEFKAI